MNNAWKTLVAGFWGGVFFMVPTLVLAPKLWWLGLFSGFAAGYLAYEFRQTLKAAATVIAECAIATVLAPKEIWEWLFAKPRPFFFSGLLAGVLTLSALVVLQPGNFVIMSLFDFYVNTVLIALAMGFTVAIASIVITETGAKKENAYWDGCSPYYKEGEFKEFPLTYANFARWLIKGLGIIFLAVLWFLLWKMWVGAVGGVVKFIKIIHSHNRVLCGFWGTFGGLTAWTLYGVKTETTLEQVFLVVSCGFTGAAFSLLAKKIIQGFFFRPKAENA